VKIGSRLAAAMIIAVTVTGLLGGASQAAAGREEGDSNLNLAQVQAIGEFAAKERFERPEEVIVVDSDERELSAEQLERVLAGGEPDGVVVRLRVDTPRLDSTLGGLSDEAGEPGSMARSIVIRLPFDITIVINGNKADVITPDCTTTTITTTTTSGNTTTTTTTTTSTCSPT
jgi:hypothetical protein